MFESVLFWLPKRKTDSKDAALINSIIKEGKLVPSKITVGLIKKAMDAKYKEGTKNFLIDGFPRNKENDDVWAEVIGDT
eukprot:UN00568